MKLGFMTNALTWKGFTDFEEIAGWGEGMGFDNMEVGPDIPLDSDLFTKALKNRTIRVHALTFCRNFLSSDKEEAEYNIAELKRRIEFAKNKDINLIVTSTGIDKTIEEKVYDRADSIRKIPMRSIDLFCKLFTPIIEYAEKLEVKIAFENCPLMGNIAISPVMWRAIFSRIDSEAIGIAYDPSHLIWQMINPYEYISEFSKKIFHIHAKDTIIDRSKLRETGILTNFSWWRYCIPGQGELDWGKFFHCLNEAGYKGTISLEHEDKNYDDSIESVKKGLREGYDFLCGYVRG